MKLILATLFFLLSASSFAFDITANCHFDAKYGECRVVNNSQMPIKCRLHIYGQTARGFSYNGYELVFLYPTQHAFAYVSANNPIFDPLVIVNGDASCKFAN